LGGRTGIPTAEQLQQLMADMEVQLFLRRPEVADGLLDAAWYLHAVASVDRARDRYTPQRQRQAFAVSAHIFDLALAQPDLPLVEQLSLGFAAAIGYRRGGRDPNATAIGHRLRGLIVVDAPVADHIGTLPLEAGLAFLGFQTRTLFTWFAEWRRQLARIADASGLPDLTGTVFGPAQMVVLGAEDLLAYFTRGNTDRLQRGRARLLQVITGTDDVQARWVSAHLLALSGEAQAGSLWNPRVMPPSVPRLVRQAFTVGNPAVLTLWEPQRDLLTGPRSPFDPETRRMVLAVPTSGGKTLLAQLLAVEQLDRTGKAVCYVAPTRSLCREVRQAMSGRVRVLQRETGVEQPDFPSSVWSIVDIADVLDPGPPPDVEVMTQERLANMLRHDAQAVLDRFEMFIFDEAQHIKDGGRGFVLESTIAMLDYLTRGSDHRIVLISAAMGNAGVIAQWLDPTGQALLHESAWRGPRRLHAVFTTDAKFDATTVEQMKITKKTVWPYRHVTELGGRIRMRLADGRLAALTTQGDTGWRLVRKAKTNGRYPGETEIDQTRSTRRYQIAADMTGMLGHAGSVLVVAGTRAQAQQLAGALAAAGREHTPLAALVDFVRGQLGDEHPLVATLRAGVGFHHAGLPTEVQEALEQAIRDDTLPYLCCTSTLTEGVNLPVRTVVIYEQSYEGQPESAQLSGARLVNAIGRAGRAGRETEGWIVLIRAAAPTAADFTDLDPDPDTLAVTSSLITDDALEQLATLEAEQHFDADTVFRAAGTRAADFVGFVWLMLATEEDRGRDPWNVDITGIVEATLAAEQSPRARDICLTLAAAIREAYARSPELARRRWPRTGTSIGSARTLDTLAADVADTIIAGAARGDLDDIADPYYLLNGQSDLWRRLLELPEAPPWRFRPTPQAVPVDVPPAPVLRDWLHGRSLSDLATTHLTAINSPAQRLEQMVDAVTGHFEHYLSWTAGALVELVNIHLGNADINERLCPDLGGYLRFGVDTSHGLILATAGIRSRRLIHAIIDDLPRTLAANLEDLRQWLAGMGIDQWRTRYMATASELLDLLEFTRLRRRSLLKTLLEEGSVQIGLPDADVFASNRDLTLRPLDGAETPAPLAVYTGNDLVATVTAEDHADVSAILDTGLAINFDYDIAPDPPTLTITLTIGDTD
jgi:hypothetical protein